MDQARRLRALVESEALKEKKEVLPKINKISNVITITSGKGGVGKTSIAINLALQLSSFGKKVVILDADMGLANVEVMLGVRPKYDMGDLMYGNMKMSDIIMQGPFGISFISGGNGIHEMNNLSINQIENLTNSMNELDELFDYVIVDTGAGISDTIMKFVKASSQVLIVTTPEPTSITDAYAVLKALDRVIDNDDNILVKMISNRVSGQYEGEVLHRKLNSVVEKFLNIKLGYLGAVIQDNNLTKGILNQQPVSVTNPNSTSVKTIRILADKIINNKETIENRGVSGFFTLLQKGFTLKNGEVS